MLLWPVRVIEPLGEVCAYIIAPGASTVPLQVSDMWTFSGSYQMSTEFGSIIKNKGRAHAKAHPGTSIV